MSMFSASVASSSDVKMAIPQYRGGPKVALSLQREHDLI